MIKAVFIVTGCIVSLFIFRFFFPLIKICGCSMYPTYYDGEIILAVRVFNKNKIKVGDVVVYSIPDPEGNKRNVVKRVADINRVGNELLFYFLGDNSLESYDSRFYGYISSDWILYKLINQRYKINDIKGGKG